MEWTDVRFAEDRYFATIDKHKQEDLNMAHFIQTVKQDYHTCCTVNNCASVNCASVIVNELSQFLTLQLSRQPSPSKEREFAVLFEAGHLRLNGYVQWLCSMVVLNVEVTTQITVKPLWHLKEMDMPDAIAGNGKFGLTNPSGCMA